MSFENPYVLFGLLLLPLLALVYIWRAGKREVTVPSLMLWKTAAAEAAAERGKRLGSLDWPLVLALLFLAIAILAASDPVIVTPAKTAPKVLVIADHSASMATKTKSGSLTRWQESVEDVSGMLDRLGSSSEVTLVGLPLAAGPCLERLSASAAKSALGKLGPTDMPLDIVSELSRCAGIARSASAVIVMTDNAGVVPAKLGDKPVLVVSHGGPSRNVAIDAFEVARAGGGGLSVFAAVKNHSSAAAEVAVQLFVDAALLEEAKLTLPPGQRKTFNSSEAIGGGAREIRLRLNVKDDLESDNAAIAVRAGAGKTRTAYIGRSNPFIIRTLGLLSGVELSQFRLASDLKGEFDLYIFDGAAPERLPAGDVVLIDPAGKVGSFTVREDAVTEKQGIRASVVKDAPILKNVDVGALRFQRVLKVNADAAAETLVTSADGKSVVLMRREDADTRVTLIGSGLLPSETNWPMLPSFPIFWSNIVADAADRRTAGTENLPTCSLTGQYVTVGQLSPSAGVAAFATSPGGERVQLAAGRGARSYFLPARAGVYAIADGPNTRRYAANMMHESESANSGTTAHPTPELEKTALASAGEIGILRLWRTLATVALVIAFAYWLTAARSSR